MTSRDTHKPRSFTPITEHPLPFSEGLDDFLDSHPQFEADDDVDTAELAEAVGSITGAEIRAVCTEAGMNAIRDGREAVKMGDFEDAYSELDDGEEETVAMSGPTAFA